jgi:hypothetical protein
MLAVNTLAQRQVADGVDQACGERDGVDQACGERQCKQSAAERVPHACHTAFERLLVEVKGAHGLAMVLIAYLTFGRDRP